MDIRKRETVNDKDKVDAYKAVIDQIIDAIGAPSNITNENVVEGVKRLVAERSAALESNRKVFILKREFEYSHTEIYGVFSSLKKAVESIQYTDPDLDTDDISEFEIDPAYGERFEQAYYSILSQDGAIYHGEQWLRPVEDGLDLGFHSGYNGAPHRVQAWSLVSKEESERIARESVHLIDPVWQVARGHNSPDLIEIHHAHPSVVHKWGIPFAVHRDLNQARIMYWEMEKSQNPRGDTISSLSNQKEQRDGSPGGKRNE